MPAILPVPERLHDPVTDDTPVYLVQWVEVEAGWGKRPEGYAVYRFKQDAITDSRQCVRAGSYVGGYCGPEIPNEVVTMRWGAVKAAVSAPTGETPAPRELGDEHRVFTANHWRPNPEIVEETFRC